MQNCKERKANRPNESCLPKKNRIYGNVQEYFSDLNFCYGINENYTQKELEKYFELLESYLKQNNPELIEKFVGHSDMKSFLKAYKECNKSKGYYSSSADIPWHTFSKDKQGIQMSDETLRCVSYHFVFIYLKPIMVAKEYMHPNLFSIVAEFITSEISRMDDTEMYWLISDKEYNKETLKEEMAYYSSDKEDDNYISAKFTYDDAMEFYRTVKYLSKRKSKPVKNPKYTENEQRLVDVIKRLEHFNYGLAIPFINVEDYWESDFIQNIGFDEIELGKYNSDKPTPGQISHAKSVLAWIQYSGQYLLCWDENDHFSNNVITYANESSGNGGWILDISGVLEIRDRGVFKPFWEYRQMLLNHYDDYCLFNDIILDIIEDAKNRKNVSREHTYVLHQ